MIKKTFSNMLKQRPVFKIIVCLVTILAAQVQEASADLFVRTKKAKYHVTFLNKIKEEVPQNTVRVFFDRYGDLYPVFDNIALQRMVMPDVKGLHKKGHVQLEDYYFNNLNKFAILYKELLGGEDADLRQYSAKNTAWDRDWKLIQGELAKRLSQKIDSKTLSKNLVGGPKTLLILIHGYNVEECETPFYEIIQKIQIADRSKVSTNNATYLEVYWDGMKMGNSLQKKTIGPVGIWGEAQLQARYVGCGLRQIIAGTDSLTPLRVFTHSSGAIVATHTFWNVRKPYNQSEYDTHPLTVDIEKQFKHRTPVHKNVRIGFLVPASPGEAFQDAINTTPPLQKAYVQPLQHIVIGWNRLDYATRKYGLGIAFGPRIAGATSTACDPKAYNLVKQTFGDKSHRIDFRQTPEGKKPEDPWKYKGRFEKHSWESYASRPQFEEFVNEVMKG